MCGWLVLQKGERSVAKGYEGFQYFSRAQMGRFLPLEDEIAISHRPRADECAPVLRSARRNLRVLGFFVGGADAVAQASESALPPLEVGDGFEQMDAPEIGP